uniref:Pre-mRNA-splicing factor SLU7 n=1 Tax=Hirondellea gigas TaxID=1518452 RepID=A0A6A7G3S5_9CRUS
MSANTLRLSREDYKKKRELEELRKAGAAPAELDDDGNMINPHIPQYISESPWYISDGRPGLKHQRQFRQPKNYADLDTFLPRGTKQGPAATKWRKGACTNCGALTHKAKACFERPRKKGARWTGKNIQADEVVLPDLNHSYEGKRDRWNGYDISLHRHVTDFHRKVEKARRKKRDRELDEALRDPTKKKRKLKKRQKRSLNKNDDSESDSDSDSDASSDSDDELKDSGLMMQQMDSKKRQTVRNLRIREDTAKYLRNLDPRSAHYDPKTRSMRENPNPELDPNELFYAGDNFTRISGDSLKFHAIENFAWESDSKGAESQKGVVHLQSNPTKSETIQKQHKMNQIKIKDQIKSDIIDKYGGAEHLDTPPMEVLLGQSNQYREFSHDGRVIKGGHLNKAIPKSKYIEDELEGNHTKTWGSFYDKSADSWGYGCCNQTTRNAYCTGEAGKRAAVEIRKSFTKRVQFPASKPEKQSKPKNLLTQILGDVPTPGEMEDYRRDKQRDMDPMASYVDEENTADAPSKRKMKKKKKKKHNKL